MEHCVHKIYEEYHNMYPSLSFFLFLSLSRDFSLFLSLTLSPLTGPDGEWIPCQTVVYGGRKPMRTDHSPLIHMYDEFRVWCGGVK